MKRALVLVIASFSLVVSYRWLFVPFVEMRGSRHERPESPVECPIGFGHETQKQPNTGARLSTALSEFRAFTNGRVELVEEDTRFVKKTIERIGIDARHSDVAWNFVTNGIRPAFWASNRTWKRINDDEFVDVELAAACVHAVGIANRPASLSLVSRLTNSPVDKELAALSGDIVQAAFYLYLLQPANSSHDTNLLRADPERLFRIFLNWRTNEGRYLSEWGERTKSQR
jgi:hypothetical protein